MPKVEVELASGNRSNEKAKVCYQVVTTENTYSQQTHGYFNIKVSHMFSKQAQTQILMPFLQ